MIVFGTCVGYPDKWRKYAIPGIQRSMDEAYSYIAVPSKGHVAGAYEDILRTVRGLSDVEALVLLHDDYELRDPNFAKKVRALLGDWRIAVAGVVGSCQSGNPSLYWWEGEIRGYATDGRGGCTVLDAGFPSGDPSCVDSVDGQLLILSHWAVHNLSFQPDAYPGLHGYPEEICAAAWSRGKRVVVTEIEGFHHSEGGYAGGKEGFDAANETFRRRWPI